MRGEHAGVVMSVTSRQGNLHGKLVTVVRRLRFFLHRDPMLLGRVRRSVLRAIEPGLRRRCPDAPRLAALEGAGCAHGQRRPTIQRACRVFLARLLQAYGLEAPVVLRRIADELEQLARDELEQPH